MPVNKFFDPKTALTKLVIYWKDGSPAGRFYSADRKRNIEHKYCEPGMNRLERVFIRPNIGRFTTALIYENRYDGATLRKYDEHGFQVNPTESWHQLNSP